MKTTSFFKKKNQIDDNAYYNEDNLVKIKESKPLETKVITASTAMRILSIIGFIGGIVILAAIAYGTYLAMDIFVDFDSLNGIEPVTPIEREDSIAKEAYPVWYE